MTSSTHARTNKMITLKLISLSLLVIFCFSSFTNQELASHNSTNTTVDIDNEQSQIDIHSIEPTIPGELLASAINNYGGVNWGPISILDNPYQPINPTIIMDSNNNTHILWANYYNGRSLYHKIILANGTPLTKTIIVTKSSGTQISMDAAADKFGNIHLVYSWGVNEGNQYTYYKKWNGSSWSSDQRVDKGKDESGNTIIARDPKITIDKYGIAHVIWSAEVQREVPDQEYRKIYYQRKLPDNSWSNVVPSGSAYWGCYDIITTDNDEMVHLVHTTKLGELLPAYHTVYYKGKLLEAATWATMQTLLMEELEGYYNAVPVPAIVALNGELHVFVNSLRHINTPLYQFTKTGSTWNVVERNHNVSYSGNIKVDAITTPYDDILVAWPNDVYYGGLFLGGITLQNYYDYADEWSTPGLITEDYTTAYDPSMVYDIRDDSVQIVWRDNHPVSGQALYYCKGILDFDNDSLSNREEQVLGVDGYITDSTDDDTDDDMLKDGEEYLLGMDPTNPDEDTDSILDGWEIQYGLDPYNATDALDDWDLDGLTNLEEFNNNTNPNLDDTDGDTLTDGYEVNTSGTDPTDSDSDDDDLDDGYEVNIVGTNPLNNDTEGDGMPDGFEVYYGLDPFTDDSLDDEDSDNLTNIAEYGYGTNPVEADTDFDGLTDDLEILTYFTDPLKTDTDEDLLSDYYEVTIDPNDDTYQTNNTYATNPLVVDTDYDLIDDYTEINVSLTNPILNDTDLDLMLDGYEWLMGLNPFVNDTLYDYDSDGLTNLQEFYYNGDPFDVDTDDDRLTDYEEYLLGTMLDNDDSDGDRWTDYIEVFWIHTDPLNNDTDYDGLDDYFEIMVYFCNPRINDTDMDGLLDGEEVYIYHSLPYLIDTDDDGLTDYQEVQFNSEPSLPDTDGDGMDDYYEWVYSFNPRVDDGIDDEDLDGLTNLEEYWFESDPYETDTDGDQINDYDEAYVYFTSPIREDTDEDGLTDFQEVFVYHTSPIDPDMDDDGLSDYEEKLVYGTNPELFDTDGDGFSDYEEVLQGTNPLDKNDNPNSNTLKIILSVLGSIVGALILYYIVPSFVRRVSKPKELEWVRKGMEERNQKHTEILNGHDS